MHQPLKPGAQAQLFVRPEAMVLLESGQSVARNDWTSYEVQV
jgi:hypothetical protein